MLSYKRNDASEDDTTEVGEWSTDLGDWSGTPVTPVLVNENGALADDVEIRVPLANAVDGKLYGRLRVTK